MRPRSATAAAQARQRRHSASRRWAERALTLCNLLVIAACGAASPEATTTVEVARADSTERSAPQVSPLVTAACRDATAWHPALKAEAQDSADDALALVEARSGPVAEPARTALRKELRNQQMWRIVRNLLLGGQLHNYGTFALPTVRKADGQPLRVFRTGFTPTPGDPGSCVRALLDAGGVRHIVNLYAGPMVTQDLESAERAAVERAGGTYDTARDAADAQHWREDLHEQGDMAAAQQAVAGLIRRSILRPGGAAPRGNVHVNCGGGMHRTGMVVGVLQRCLGQASAADVEAAYKHHVAWRTAAEPGGFEPENLQFIMSFDCKLLTSPDAAPKPAS